jgi:hypothetical protein
MHQGNLPTVKQEYTNKLIQRINRKDWWHVPPRDPQSYSKRGKFLSSTYREAEFYGRPNDIPEHVAVHNPLVGDEATIETVLLGKPAIHNPHAGNAAEQQLALDAKLHNAGRAKGYDAIVLLSPAGYTKFKDEGRIPLSIELNSGEIGNEQRQQAPNRRNQPVGGPGQPDGHR